MSTILDAFSKVFQSFDELKATEDYQELNSQAYTVVFESLILIVILELYSWETVQQLWKKQSSGKELYVKALFLNFFNLYAIAIPAQIVAGLLLTSNNATPSDDDGSLMMLGQRLLRSVVEIVYLWTIHCIGYYYIHKSFHESPKLYKYHKFHHRFNTYVTPVSANAVEAVEYVLAYLLPFVIALVLWPFPQKINRNNFGIATRIISVLNLLVHTPKLDGKYMGHHNDHENETTEEHAGGSLTSWTWWFVSTEDHLDHHRKLKVHYASPTINIDNIVGAWSSKK